MSERIVRRAIIRGRVQGVGYRDWTRHVARGRDIEGWVRNRRDGSFESIEEHEASETELALRGEKSFVVLPTA